MDDRKRGSKPFIAAVFMGGEMGYLHSSQLLFPFEFMITKVGTQSQQQLLITSPALHLSQLTDLIRERKKNLKVLLSVHALV